MLRVPCCVALCCVMLCNATLCCAMPRCVVLCQVVVCCAKLWCAALCYVVVPCCATLCSAVLCYVVPCHVLLCCAVLINFFFFRLYNKISAVNNGLSSSCVLCSNHYCCVLLHKCIQLGLVTTTAQQTLTAVSRFRFDLVHL